MKKLLCLLLMSGSALAQQSQVKTPPAPTFLAITPITFVNGGQMPGFSLRTSTDGTNWQTLRDGISGILPDLKQCFTPCIAYMGTNFVVFSDPFSVGGTVSNVWRLSLSPDLATWTHSFLTNTTAWRGGLAGGGRFTYDGLGWHFIAPVGPDNMNVEMHPLDVNGASWSGPSSVSTNFGGDNSFIFENGKYYMFAGYGGSLADVYTNDGSAITNSYTLAVHNIFAGATIESPQVVKLGQSNFIMYVTGIPSHLQKTYYSTSSNLFQWTALQEINENGVFPGRMDVLRLTPTTAASVNRIAQTNVANAIFDNVYYLNTASGTTTATSPPVPFGAAAAAKIKWDVVAFGGVGDGTYDVGEWTIEGLFAEDWNGITSSMYQVGDLKVLNINRPATTWTVGVTFLQADESGNVSGWDYGPYLKVTGPSTRTIRWKVRQRVEVAAPSLVAAVDGIWLGTAPVVESVIGDVSGATNAWRKETIFGSTVTNGAVTLGTYFHANLYGRSAPWAVQNYTNGVMSMLPRYGYLSNLTVGVGTPFAGTTNIVFCIKTNYIGASGAYLGLGDSALKATLRGSVSTPTYTNLTGVGMAITADSVGVMEIVPSAALQVTTNFWWSFEHWYQDH